MMGFGVYALDGDTTREAVGLALEAGYRHFDTAQSYKNEADCGIAIARSGLPREEIFITTKVTPRNYAVGKMLGSVYESLDRLRVDCIDLLLIHYPSPWDQIPMEVYLEQLLAVQQAGLASLIGVSNFTIAQVDRALKLLGRDNLATNQVEIHVFMQNRKIVDHCRTVGVPTTAYCALARGALLGAPEAQLGPHPILQEIADAHDATVAQIGLSFLMHEGHVVLSSATQKDQIESNFAATNVRLTQEEFMRLRSLDMNKRIVEWPYFPIFD